MKNFTQKGANATLYTYFSVDSPDPYQALIQDPQFDGPSTQFRCSVHLRGSVGEPYLIAKCGWYGYES